MRSYALSDHLRPSARLDYADDDRRNVIDFLSCAGALNYGQNNHEIRAAIRLYLASDTVVHGLDMLTPAKLEFVETFDGIVLRSGDCDIDFNLQDQQALPTDANASKHREKSPAGIAA